MKHVIELSDESFVREVVESGQPVLVDFWAPWCGPCRAVAPTIEAVAEAYEGKAKVAKLNVEEHQQVAGQLRIQAIPTVAVFKDGQVVEVRVGALPKAQYEQMLENALTGATA